MKEVEGEGKMLVMFVSYMEVDLLLEEELLLLLFSLFLEW